MRTTAIIVFFGIAFLIIGLISFYIYIRGLQSLPLDSALRQPYKIVFWIVALSFFGGRLFEKYLPSFISQLFIWIGSFWIAAVIYFLMIVVFLDILRLINHFLPFFPSMITSHASS